MKFLITFIFIALPFQVLGKDYVTKQERKIIRSLKRAYRLENVAIQRPNKTFMYYELCNKDGKIMIADSTGNVIIPLLSTKNC